MTLADELKRSNIIFIDTAPIIYYIEAHPQFGPLICEIVDAFQTGKVNAITSVLTLTEVLSKPIAAGNERLAKKFAEFLRYGKNLSLIEISVSIAERAGRLRGRYPNLKTMDAIQLAVALDAGADAFLTNDKQLKGVKEM